MMQVYSILHQYEELEMDRFRAGPVNMPGTSIPDAGPQRVKHGQAELTSSAIEAARQHL